MTNLSSHDQDLPCPNPPFISTTGLYLSVNKVYLRKVANALRFPMVALMATFYTPVL